MPLARPSHHRQCCWLDLVPLWLPPSCVQGGPRASPAPSQNCPHLWSWTTALATERHIGDFRLPDVDDLSPTDYVLDGQQRLTVLYSVLGAKSEGEGFEAVYNLNDKSFHAAQG